MNLFQSLKYYFRIYLKFCSTSIAMHTSFRVSFVLLILMDIAFLATTLSSIDFIYDHVTHIGPWNKNQLLFFMSYMLLLDNLHMIFFSESFWEFSHTLKTGNFDFTILKPAGSIFSTFFRFFRPSSALINPLFVFFVIKYGNEIGLHFIQWLLIPLFLILSLALLVSLEFLLSTLNFWLTEGIGINFLRMQFQQLARWPDFIYQNISRKVLITVIPVLLIGSAPVRVLIDLNHWHWILFMGIAIFLAILILNKFWKFALKNYSSASS